MRPLIRFLYTTGMRVMEPANMPWGEVNLKHGELRISGLRTENGQQKVLYLSGEPLEIFKGAESVPQCDGAPLRYPKFVTKTSITGFWF